MNDYIKIKIISSIEFLHVKIFGHEISQEMIIFLKNLSWSFFGGLTATALLAILNIIAGRLLGPEKFGEYNYIVSLSSIFIFIFLLGNNLGSILNISDKNSRRGKEKILSASLGIFFFQVILFIVLFFYPIRYLFEKMNISDNVFTLSLCLGLTLAFRELVNSYLRAFLFFKIQSVFKIIEATSILIVFFFLYFNFADSSTGSLFYLISIMVGGAFFILLGMGILFFSFKITNFNFKEVKVLFSYNRLMFFFSIGGFLISLDKFFIGKYIGTESLGVYSAYFSSSQLVISNLYLIFANTFWPTLIKNKEQIRNVTKKLKILMFRYFPLWLIISFCVVSFFVYLFGKKYPFDTTLIILFSIVSLLNVFFSAFISILNIEKMRLSAILTIIVYLSMIILIPIFRDIKIYVFSQIIIYLISTLFIYYNLMSKKNDKNLLSQS